MLICNSPQCFGVMPANNLPTVLAESIALDDKPNSMKVHSLEAISTDLTEPETLKLKMSALQLTDATAIEDQPPPGIEPSNTSSTEIAALKATATKESGHAIPFKQSASERSKQDPVNTPESKTPTAKPRVANDPARNLKTTTKKVSSLLHICFLVVLSCLEAARCG